MEPTKKTISEARVDAGVSQLQIAAAANVALATIRSYELDPSSVRPAKRVAIAAAYARLVAGG
jgi:transcriptional regulator with XRE-family HTH domain